jgi:uncharacterized protein YacL
MASNLPPSDLSTTLLPVVSSILKLFAWMVFGFLLIGAIAEILGLLPLYQLVIPMISTFLLRLAAVIVLFIGFVAMTLSIR